MSDLVEFLRARLDEDRAWADNPECAEDPARVLREVEAKRLIVDQHSPIDRPSRQDYDPSTERCRTCAAQANGNWQRFRAPCPTLRLLALPYAKHADYRPEWAIDR